MTTRVFVPQDTTACALGADGALDGDFIRSVKHIAIGWGIIFGYLTYKEIMQRKRSVETE